jgi:hypothetical protein
VSSLTEYATSPAVTVPVGSATVAVGFIGNLPVMINIAVGIYFSLMVIHKLYQMVKEWRADHKDASCK